MTSESVETAVNPHENLLGQVLGEGLVSHYEHDVSPDTTLHLSDDPSEGIDLTCGSSCDVARRWFFHGHVVRTTRLICRGCVSSSWVLIVQVRIRYCPFMRSDDGTADPVHEDQASTGPTPGRRTAFSRPG